MKAAFTFVGMLFCLCGTTQSLTGTWLAAYHRDQPGDKRIFYYRIYLQQKNDTLYAICHVLDAQSDIKGIDPEKAEVQGAYKLKGQSSVSAREGGSFELFTSEAIEANGAATAPVFSKWSLTMGASGKDFFTQKPQLIYSLLPATDGPVGNLHVKKIAADIPGWIQFEPPVPLKLSLKLPSLLKGKKKEAGAGRNEPAPVLTVAERKDVLHRVIETEAAEATIDLYDNGLIDDDTVSLYLNGRLIIDRKKVSAEPLRLTVSLDGQGENRFVLFAHNEGRMPPNTALMIIRAGQYRYELTLKSTLTENALVLLSAKPLQPVGAKGK